MKRYKTTAIVLLAAIATATANEIKLSSLTPRTIPSDMPIYSQGTTLAISRFTSGEVPAKTTYSRTLPAAYFTIFPLLQRLSAHTAYALLETRISLGRGFT
jgi:hypothetical protein